MTNYADLRRLGIEYLEQMNGGTWTDFNAHDPGITILETLCYALTDLDYRTEHDVPDLLANGGSDPHESLHDPAALLTTRAVTTQDLRRLILDVVGVKNAWIDYVDEPLESQGASIIGVYRVLLEVSEEREGVDVRREVGKRLHKHRGLCEDFVDIVVLDPLPIAVQAQIEIGRVDDPNVTYAAILDAISESMSPTIRMASLAERQADDVPIDEIFDGPLLDHGFIPDHVLANSRDRAIHVSDIIHAVKDVRGVRAVTGVVLSAGGQTETWSLSIPLDRAPTLDRYASKIQLLNAGLPVAMGPTPPAPSFPRRNASGPYGGLTLPTGRDRNVARYHSILHHLPMLYGVGEAGLSDAESTERKALAKQLKAYLMFFDQLMANHLAQLGHVKNLFSIYPDASQRTYFAQTLQEPALDLLSIVKATQQDLERLVESPLKASARKDRFLNHLLARFAEHLNDRYSAAYGEAANANDVLILQKQQFLEQYPRISGSRGTAYDGLGPFGSANPSGLEDRIRFKLGLEESQDETMAMVEHVLLRPTMSHHIEWFEQLLPNQNGDKYSMQISFVFPGAAKKGRFSNPAFRQVVEQTLRSQTPAHIAVYAVWLDAVTWEKFQKDHTEWRRRRREHFASKLGISLGLDPRLITYIKNLPALPVGSNPTTAVPRLADYGKTARVEVEGSQEGNAGYTLIGESDGKFYSTASVLGTGKTISIESIELTEDLVLRVQVDRLFDATILLDTPLPVQVRANPALEVSATAGDSCEAPGESIAVQVEKSQKSVSYRVYKRHLSDEDFFLPPKTNGVKLNLSAIANVIPAQETWVGPPPEKVWTSADYAACGNAKRGNGSALVLDAGTMDEDALLVVQAHKDHGATPADATDVQLLQAVLFLKRPRTDVTLTLKKTSATTITLSGGEEGVFYYLIDPGTNKLLGAPAYFQRMRTATVNRGIGGMRIGHDFAVARGTVPAEANRATTKPLDPVVTVSTIPAGNKVKVMAVRGRTGAPWAAMQEKTIVT